MKQLNNDNAANRSSYVGFVYNIGEKVYKDNILDSLPKEWADLHRNGDIHIHDLDAYDLTYNCLTLDIVSNFPYKLFEGYSSQRKLIALFDFIKNLFTDLGNEQSGGMAFANFDNELSTVFKSLEIDYTKNLDLIKDLISELIVWCNDTHTRMGQTSYYVTFNIGLANDECARFIAYELMNQFEMSGHMIFKPNIVFKIKDGINLNFEDKNYDLLLKALDVSAKKMIPTFLLCDCKEDKNIDPNELAIVGCRTRVTEDLYGKTRAIGRGNISNISINLPRLALKIENDYSDLSIDEKLDLLYKSWDKVASITKDILIDKFNKICNKSVEDFPINSKYHLWNVDFKNNFLIDIFKHGTLSIGFIGLSETIEILTGKKYYESLENYIIALGFVKHMKDYCDFLKNEYKLNFSLLATSGELISGRFIEIDKHIYHIHKNIFDRGFYTNSFHVNVDSKLPGYKKLEIEGLFHELCNGGSISYIELGEAPLENIEGLYEYLLIAIKSGIHYLGFNYPKDVCNNCKCSGIFDVCPNCKSDKITRIRRVSGYLEILDGFTNGKKAEERNRRKN